MAALFRDRRDAGRVLARRLAGHSIRPGIVLGLPRGGVPVAYEVAKELALPLDVFLVRKLGVPTHEELAMGAIASGNIRVLNSEVIKELNIEPHEIDEVTQREEAELERRERAYRDGLPNVPVRGNRVLVVDDGLATGASMRAAIEALRLAEAESVTVAVPVAPREACHEMGRLADHVLCAATPEPFYGVGLWYQQFPPVSDHEVTSLLAEARSTAARNEPG